MTSWPRRAPALDRWRFRGFIAGLGTASGTRLVVGHWPRSPLGPFTDVMVEHANGQRLLLAPFEEVADLVADKYSFDEVAIQPVLLATDGPRAAGRRWHVEAGPLRLRFLAGPRTSLGWVLRTIPTPLARQPGFATLIDPLASRVLSGVHTAGRGPSGRRSWYCATDMHAIMLAEAHWEGRDLGGLRPVEPAVGFGFSSTPRHPCVTTVVSTVEVATVPSQRRPHARIGGESS